MLLRLGRSVCMYALQCFPTAELIYIYIYDCTFNYHAHLILQWPGHGLMYNYASLSIT